MKAHRSPIAKCVCLTALPLLASLAWGQAAQTWVSGQGNDANACTLAAPCQSFAGALTKTTAGGEISILDAGPFGAVTITKSITINAVGAIGSINAASGTSAITINANAG